MKDRVPAKPGRVLITPENGSAPFYATMTRADNPTQEGDPLNKNTLLKDATAALFGLGADAVPDDAFAFLGKYNEYWWQKTVATFEARTIQISSRFSLSSGNVAAAKQRPIYYADSFSVNQDTGEVDLVNPSETKVDYQNYSHVNSTLRGKYIKNAVSDPSAVYFIPETASVTLYGSYDVCYNAEPYPQKISSILTLGDATFVQSSDRNEYDDYLISGGYEYKFVGKPFENAVFAGQIETGSYAGSGLKGSDNPNKLTFKSPPKFIFIQDVSDSPFSNMLALVNGAKKVYSIYAGSSSYDLSVTWNGNEVSWYSASYNDSQMNGSGHTYNYIAIL